MRDFSSTIRKLVHATMFKASYTWTPKTSTKSSLPLSWRCLLVLWGGGMISWDSSSSFKFEEHHLFFVTIWSPRLPNVASSTNFPFLFLALLVVFLCIKISLTSKVVKWSRYPTLNFSHEACSLVGVESFRHSKYQP